MESSLFSIKVVCLRTGLSAHVIRVWEKRYRTISPVRSGGNQRQYTVSDIDRLTLLKRATESGYAIGTIAALSTDQLRGLLVSEEPSRVKNTPAKRLIEPRKISDSDATTIRDFGVEEAVKLNSSAFLNQAMEFVRSMNTVGLESVLDQSLVALGQIQALNRIVVPLMIQMGEGWMMGEITIAQEHLATAVVRTYLGQVLRTSYLHPRAPGILVATPVGQCHEMGAIVAAVAASGLGWRVVYGSSSLPTEEIASVAIRLGVRVVGLSIVHPSDDPMLGPELVRLRRLLPATIGIIIGGQAASSYLSFIRQIGAVSVSDIGQLSETLNRFRQISGNEIEAP
ncbi:MAG: MerR family transcriptional regulator [Pedosphaera sp.]|nr:MerR family transcriptional regulator [Pedosphaera sp.]